MTRSSPNSCWDRFAIAAEQTVGLKMADVKQSTTNDSTHHAWNFLWSKYQLVGFWCRCILIWILESRLIRSNNQSRATLWVLETCRIVGLLPLIIILITALLSSNTYNKASWRADWTIWGNGINILHHIDPLLRFMMLVNIINRSPCSFWNLRHASKNRNN